MWDLYTSALASESQLSDYCPGSSVTTCSDVYFLRCSWSTLWFIHYLSSWIHLTALDETKWSPFVSCLNVRLFLVLSTTYLLSKLTILLCKEVKLNCFFKGWKGMYILVVPSLSTKFIENSHQNLPVLPIFRDKAWHAVWNSQVSWNSHSFRKSSYFTLKFPISCKTLFCCYLCPHKFTKKANVFIN